MCIRDRGRSKGALFLNRFGNPITASGIRGQLKTFAVRYNLDPEVVYPHSFRHRFAKNFIEKSGDIALLSDLLGHESIETTRIYLRRSSSEQYQLINKIVDWWGENTMTDFQQEEIEIFKEYLRKRGAAPNTISAYSASVRLYFSLYSDINITNLQSYKEYLLEHFKANTVNIRIFGINQYIETLSNNCLLYTSRCV